MGKRLAVPGILAVCIVGALLWRGDHPTQPLVGSGGPLPTNGMTGSSFARLFEENDYQGPTASPTRAPTNFFQRLSAGDFADLTPTQWAEYFRQFGTNAETLLATQSRENIRLAAELFPEDPRVQFAVLARDLFPEERSAWLENFKASAPSNALANYLAARDALRQGNRDLALQELAAASSKPQFNDYLKEHIQNREDAQLLAGRSPAEAKAAAAVSLAFPHLQLMKSLSQEMQSMQVDLLKAGDTTSAQALSASGAILAQHLMTGDGSLCLINQLVGAVVERNLLSKLPPESQPDFLNGTVQQRIDQLAAFRKSTIPLVQLSDDMFSRGNEAEIAGFFDRLKLQGEYQALLWLQRKDQYRSGLAQ